MRCQIVPLWAEHEPRAAIARGVGCSPSRVDRVTRRFRDHGVAGPHDRREDNGQVKLDEAFPSTPYAVVGGQPTEHGFTRPRWTRELHAAVMAEWSGTRVHPGTMSGALRMIGARLGRPKPTVGYPWPEVDSRSDERRAGVDYKILDGLVPVGGDAGCRARDGRRPIRWRRNG